MTNYGIAIGGGKAFSVSLVTIVCILLLAFLSGVVYSKRTGEFLK